MSAGLPEAKPPVRSTPPPMWFINGFLNPVMRRLVPSPAGRLVPGFAVLTFRGRRSGRTFVVPTAIYDYEGAQVVFTDSSWLANFRGGTPVEVARRGRVVHGSGELVEDPDRVGTALRAVLAAGASRLILGVAIDKGHQPTDDELSAVRKAIVVRALND